MTPGPQALRSAAAAAPDSPAHGVLRTAIEGRQSVTLHYDNYLRFLSPHALGTDAQGRAAVLAYQYGGGKRGGLRVNGEWVCLALDGITSARLNSDSWNAGRGAPAPALCLREVEIAADPASAAFTP